MKPDNKDEKFKRKSEFRHHSVFVKTRKGAKKIKNHPTFILLQNGDIFIYVQMTHSKKIRGKVLIKMRKNPNPYDVRDSYYIEEILEDKTTNFGKKYDKWIINDIDENDIRNLYNKIKSPK